MIEVIPAIMPESFSDIEEKVSAVSSLVSVVQLDLMDGKFVPPKTWPYTSYNDPDFANLLSEENGLPEWGTIDYEIDLMSEMPESDAFDWIKAGAKRIVLHFESSDEIEKLIGEIRNEFGHPKDSATAPEVGLASNNDTAFSEWRHLLTLVDFVQVMGIAKIGYQGEPFDERALPRIKEIREKFPDLPVSVDGAVNKDTAGRLVEAGATRLISGSFVYEDADSSDEIKFLQSL